MKKLLLASLCLLVPGCAQLGMVKEARDAAVKTSVFEYCKLPESVRMANRERFKMAPDKEPFIRIFCENL